MAYSKQALTAIYPFGAGGQTAAALEAADIPFVVAHNCLRDASRIQWRYSENWSTGTDDTSAGAPATRLCDGFTHLQTTPDTVAANRHALLIEWPDGALASFDTIAIIGHNLGGYAFEIDATVVVTDAADFSSGEIATTFYMGEGGTRRQRASLSHRYTGVKYARVIFESAGDNFWPAVAELVFGKRCCLPRFPDEPWDNRAFRTSQTRQTTNAGVESRVIYSTKQRLIDATVTTKDSYEAAELNRIYTESNGCSRPVLWLDDPTGSSFRCNLLNIDEDEWRSPFVGPTEREFRIVGSEQGPLFHEGEV